MAGPLSFASSPSSASSPSFPSAALPPPPPPISVASAAVSLTAASLASRWPVFLKLFAVSSTGVLSYRIDMDIGRTSIGSMGDWCVEEAQLRPFTAFTADDAPRPPPPGDWVWPHEGDRIEVEVRRPAP